MVMNPQHYGTPVSVLRGGRNAPVCARLFPIMAVLVPKRHCTGLYTSNRPRSDRRHRGWQVNSEPIVVAAAVTTHPRDADFDGQVMTQIDVFERVPVYADTTPSRTVVYVPSRAIGCASTSGAATRTRRHAGSRTPSFPVRFGNAPAGASAGRNHRNIVPAVVGSRESVPHAPRTLIETIPPRERHQRRVGRIQRRALVQRGPAASYRRTASAVGDIAAFRSTARPEQERRSGCGRDGGPLAPYARR